jgi:S-methylmethionine-dependent homocysteine/selenocysteine methylase
VNGYKGGNRLMITVLDGGMGAELLRRSGHRTPLWSAQALIDDPDAVVQTHLDYIAAGARVITTNSYSTVPSYLKAAGLEARYRELTVLAGELARRAATESGEDVLVAGSLPPLSESYRPDLVPPPDEALPVYTAMAEALEPHIDLFICETMSSAQEGQNAATAAKAAAAARHLPVYISWTLDETPGEGLRSGESVGEAFAAVADLELDGFLFNCTSPEAIEEGLRTLVPLTTKPIGGYPNRYVVPEGWTLGQDVAERGEELSERLFVEAALRAIDIGASIYGGCCTVGPSDIAALAGAVR